MTVQENRLTYSLSVVILGFFAVFVTSSLASSSIEPDNDGAEGKPERNSKAGHHSHQQIVTSHILFMLLSAAAAAAISCRRLLASTKAL